MLLDTLQILQDIHKKGNSRPSAQVIFTQLDESDMGSCPHSPTIIKQWQ